MHSVMEPISTILPRALRALFVTRYHFVTTQHWRAWADGRPVRTHCTRWKLKPEVRERIQQRYRYRCQWPACGKAEGVTIEHLVPVVLGGSNDDCNLTLLCPAHQAASFGRFRDVLKAVDAEGAA